jgi:hypothetical protein
MVMNAINKNAPPRGEYPDSLSDPFSRPRQPALSVFAFFPLTEIFVQIVWRISDDKLRRAAWKRFHPLDAINV